MLSARQSSASLLGPRIVIGSVRSAFGTVSQIVEADNALAWHPVLCPERHLAVEPAIPACHDGEDDVPGFGSASSRVRTQTGWRPSSASSSQQTSPRLAKAARGPPHGRSPAPSGPRARRAHPGTASTPHRGTRPARSATPLPATPRSPARPSSGVLPSAAAPWRSRP